MAGENPYTHTLVAHSIETHIDTYDPQTPCCLDVWISDLQFRVNIIQVPLETLTA